MSKMLKILKCVEQYMECVDLGLREILTLWHSSAQACFFSFLLTNIKNVKISKMLKIPKLPKLKKFENI